MDARVRLSETAARHDVMSRMIDEELLVQHALDIGAAATNPEVRAALVRSAITRVNSEAAAEPVSQGELERYFEAHKEVYAAVGSFDVTPVYFVAGAAGGDGEAGARAGSAASSGAGEPRGGSANTGTAANSRRAGSAASGSADPAADDAGGLGGAGANTRSAATRSTAGSPAVAPADGAAEGPPGGVAEAGGPAAGANTAWSRCAAARAAVEGGASIAEIAARADPLPFAPPGRRVSARTLANYFGPAIADAVGRLTAGHTTEVTQLGNGVVFLYLNNKTPGELPTLTSIRDLVAAVTLRDRQEHALEALLASLRHSAHIEFATTPNPAPPVTASR
jgi:hypothetical protein